MSNGLERSFIYSSLRNWVMGRDSSARMERKEVERNKAEKNVWIDRCMWKLKSTEGL